MCTFGITCKRGISVVEVSKYLSTAGTIFRLWTNSEKFSTKGFNLCGVDWFVRISIAKVLGTLCPVPEFGDNCESQVFVGNLDEVFLLAQEVHETASLGVSSEGSSRQSVNL